LHFARLTLPSSDWFAANEICVSDPPLELPSLTNLHVLVVGDVMLDRYWLGDADRVSPEAPVPVVRVASEEQRPGGAANVALNVVSLGAKCTLVSVVGNDTAANDLRMTLEAAGVVCDFVTVDAWPTVVKLRVIAQKQQLIRADFEDPLPDDGASERNASILNKVEKYLQSTDVCVIEDYDKGVIAEPQAIIHAARASDVPVVVDPKLKPLAEFARATIVKPNEKEFLHAAGPLATADYSATAQNLCAQLPIEHLVVTRGGDGMEVVSANESRHLPARPVDVFDVTGAGDTAAAALGVALAAGLAALDCARIANIAASIVVSKLGTTAVTGPELRQVLQSGRTDRGLLTRDELSDAVAHAKAAGETIVFTNGCFDILHAGHVTYLEEAAALGDRLVIAINDNASVTRLKGEGRPIVSVEGRARVLVGLACVDWVTSFAEDTPLAVLELLQPDILVKGGDYGSDEVVGADFVRGYGGNVEVLSLVEDVSTTNIVDRIRTS
jgi:D-beta-D-heptose 7-phosphate kinase/D-beta-D-heptose 1-phosphate adenosyltransferase